MYNPYLPNNGLGLQYGQASAVINPNATNSQLHVYGQEIIRVHGEEGAKAFALGPNSSVLLMDETDNIIWAKMTDGAGYATLRGFRITPIEKEMNSDEPMHREQYVSKKEFDELKARFNRLTEDLNGESDN